MADATDGAGDFVSFYRGYARSGVHAATAALLTLFGLLWSVAGHWAFVAVGVAAYVFPPAYLYATRDSGTGAADADAAADAARNRSSGWRWRPRDPPTDADLADAAAAADGAYAAGAGGVLLARREGNWEAVIEEGAGGAGNDFTAVDATSDGRAVWAVGDGGAVARVDADGGRHVDLSAPNDLTSTWTGVAVAGPAGEETAYLANGSGVVLRGVVADGDVTWGEGAKPGSGSSVADLDFPAPRRGLVCDTAGGVFETRDGDAFERVGVDDPGGTPTAVIAGDGARGGNADADGDGDSGLVDAIVAADDGSLHRRGRAGWTSDRPTDAALFGLADGSGDRLAVGGRGTILVDGGDGWTAESAPVDAALRGAALLADGTALAVGDGGAAVERRPAADAD